MNTRINEFEKSAIASAETLRNEIGAKRIVIEISVDNYEMGCKTDVSYFTSIPRDATHVPGCGPACKGD